MSDEFLVNNDTPGSRDFVIPKEVYEIVIVIGDHIKWGKGYGKYALECLLRIVFLSDVLKKWYQKLKFKMRNLIC